MKRAIIVFILGTLAGAAALILINLPSTEEELETFSTQKTIDTLNAEIATLRTELSQANAKISALEAASPSPSASTDDPTIAANNGPNPITNFADLLTEARPLIQRMAPMLQNMRKQGQTQWITSEVAKWTEKLDLTEAQADAVSKLMTEKADAFAAEDAARLDNSSIPMTQLFPNRETWERRALAIDDVMEQTLSGDQYESYRTEQLTERATNITDSANRKVERLSESLTLDDSQQDQLFEILVKKSPSYDPAMQIETSLDGSLAETLDPAISEEDAVRRILTEEQAPTYESYLEERQGRRGGFPMFPR